MNLPSSITTRLEYQHQAIIELVEGLSDAHIRMSIHQGKWSIFENIAHLESYQHTFIHRIRRILDEDNPEFDRYTAEADPLFHESVGKPSRLILQDLFHTRKQMSSAILSFPEKDLHRTGTHSFYGPMTLIEWLNFFLLHEAHHLFTIFKLGAELKKQDL